MNTFFIHFCYYYLYILRDGRSGNRIAMGARLSAPVQGGPGAHPASYTMGTGSFPGVKRPGCGVDHPPPCSTEFKERVELYLCSSSGPSWPVLGWPLPLLSQYFYWHMTCIKAADKIIRINLRILNHSSFCVLNFMLSECRQNLPKLPEPHKMFSKRELAECSSYLTRASEWNTQKICTSGTVERSAFRHQPTRRYRYQCTIILTF